MTAPAVEDWTLVDLVAEDDAPLPSLHRRAVLLAIIACATEHDGLVHASWVRALTPAWVKDKTRGGQMTRLVSRGILVASGRVEPSGDRRNRNGNRLLHVYRVADWARLEEEARR